MLLIEEKYIEFGQILTDTVPVNSKNRKLIMKNIVVEPAAMYW